MTLFHETQVTRGYRKDAVEPGLFTRLLARIGYGKPEAHQLRAARDRSHGIAVSFDFVAPHLIHDRRIYVVEGQSRPLFGLVSKIAGPALSIVSVGDFASAERAIKGFGYEKALLVLDIDTLGTTTQAVEALIAFRKRSPDTPVVIGSGSFARHDFSMARGVIADASVRLPCDCVSVALAIESAVGNSAMRFRAA
ncbi:hypothetical protein [Roseinatronobacter sp.]